MTDNRDWAAEIVMEILNQCGTDDHVHLDRLREAFRGKWRGRIVSEGKTYSLGRFVNKSDAAKSRKAAEEKFGFTERHGCAPT